MNRAPGPKDPWWADHQRDCGGKYTKFKEPEDYGKKKNTKKSKNEVVGNSVKEKKLGRKEKKSGGKQSTLDAFLAEASSSKKAPEPVTTGDGAYSTCDTKSLNEKRDWSKLGFKTSPTISEPPKKLPRISPPSDSPSLVASKEPHVQCPCCDQSVPESKINSHLDECLNREVLSQDASCSGEAKKLDVIDLVDDDDDAEESSECPEASRVLCPVCCDMIDATDAVKHVDDHFSEST
jgi:hypothetical protein